MKQSNLPQATLIFLRKKDQILLAMKKRGFGVGRWNGVGGKPEKDERIEDTAIRECIEEISVKPLDLDHVATLDFLFADKPEWNQQVLVYNSWKWDGEPIESEEMKPQWFDLNEIPYSEMWSDDKHWLPRVLTGGKVKGEFHFTEDQNLSSFRMQEL